MTYEEKLLSGDYVVGMNIKDIVKLDDWQQLRESLVGTWKKIPDVNLQRLKDFGGDLTSLNNRRLRILQNYLTGSAFRIGKIESSSITEFTNQVRNEVELRKKDGRWQ